jgi:hypothetical protein
MRGRTSLPSIRPLFWRRVRDGFPAAGQAPYTLPRERLLELKAKYGALLDGRFNTLALDWLLAQGEV